MHGHRLVEMPSRRFRIHHTVGLGIAYRAMGRQVVHIRHMYDIFAYIATRNPSR